MKLIQELSVLNEASKEDKADSLIQKIADGTGISYRNIKNVFSSGSGEGNKSTLAKLEKDGYNSGGAWPENQKWFKKHGVTKAEYNAICDLCESANLTEAYDSTVIGNLIDEVEDLVSDASKIASSSEWSKQLKVAASELNSDELSILTGELQTAFKKVFSVINQLKTASDE